MIEELANKLVIRQSSKALLIESAFLYLVLFFFMLIALVMFLIAIPIVSKVISLNVIGFVFFLMVAAVLFMALLIFFTVKNYSKKREYVVTSENIMDCNAFFGSSCIAYELKGVTLMEIHQTPLGKRFNYGNLIIRFLGGGSLQMKSIPNPDNVLNEIHQYMKKK